MLGIGWSFAFFAFIARNKWLVRSPQHVLTLPRTINLELAAMSAATLIAFIIPVVGNINLIMPAVLLTIFAWYLFRLSHQAVEAPDVGGPAAVVTDLPAVRRRIVIVLLFAYAGLAIVLSAEPFADGLIELGEHLGIDEFLLVQWLAPLASESPEFLAALYLVWRSAVRHGMTALISSKVNQFTLLIASLPIAFAISGGTLDGLPMDSRQEGEVFLTAAQSMLGGIILDRRFTILEAVALAALFLAQFLFTDNDIRLGFAITYNVLAGAMLTRRYQLIPAVLADAFSRGSIPSDEPQNAGSQAADPQQA